MNVEVYQPVPVKAAEYSRWPGSRKLSSAVWHNSCAAVAMRIHTKTSTDASRCLDRANSSSRAWHVACSWGVEALNPYKSQTPSALSPFGYRSQARGCCEACDWLVLKLLSTSLLNLARTPLGYVLYLRCCRLNCLMRLS